MSSIIARLTFPLLCPGCGTSIKSPSGLSRHIDSSSKCAAAVCRQERPQQEEQASETPPSAPPDVSSPSLSVARMPAPDSANYSLGSLHPPSPQPPSSSRLNPNALSGHSLPSHFLSPAKRRLSPMLSPGRSSKARLYVFGESPISSDGAFAAIDQDSDDDDKKLPPDDDTSVLSTRSDSSRNNTEFLSHVFEHTQDPNESSSIMGPSHAAEGDEDDLPQYPDDYDHQPTDDAAVLQSPTTTDSANPLPPFAPPVPPSNQNPLEFDALYSKCDQSLFQMQNEFSQKGGWKDGNTIKARGLQRGIELQVLLRDSGAPLNLYDKIVAWVGRCEDSFLFRRPHDPKPDDEDLIIPSRKVLFSSLYERFNLRAMQPQRVKVYLPNAKTSVLLTKFDAWATFLSLLTNPELMNDDCLQFLFPDCPWGSVPENHPVRHGQPFPDNHVFDDVNSGIRYIQAHIKLCTGPRDVLVPVHFFCDKTHTEVKGNKTLEALCMTLGIFKRSYRNTPKAWAVLGYIPNKLSYKAARTSEERCSDFHVMVHEIVKPLETMLGEPGFRWTFHYKGRQYDSILKGYLAFCCGDHEGQDKMAGHLLNRTCVSGICRFCDVTLEESDNPRYDFSITDHRYIDQLMKERKAQMLKELSYYCLSHGRALSGIENGVPANVEVAYLLPSDILHSNQHGCQMYAKESLVDMKRQTNAARKRALDRSRPNSSKTDSVVKSQGEDDNDVVADQVRVDGDYYAPTTKTSEQDLQKIKVFSKYNISEWEPILLRWGYLLQQQADDDRPRTVFPNGVFSLTKVNAQETSGSILLLSIFIGSSYGEYLFGDPKAQQRPASRRNLGLMGDDRRKQWFQSLQFLLMYECVQKSSSLTQHDTVLLERFLPHFLELLKATFMRGTGQGMKLLKYHVQLHCPGEIRHNGSMLNTDTAAGESNHKVICKRTAKNTQHRLDTFDFQCGKRYSEDLILDRAMSLLERVYKIPYPGTPVPGSFPRDQYGVRSHMFDVTTSGIYLKQRDNPGGISVHTPHNGKMKKAVWIDALLQNSVQLFWDKFVKSADPMSRSVMKIRLYNEYAMPVQSGDDPDDVQRTTRYHFRADPRWKREKGLGHGRHDWANIVLPEGHQLHKICHIDHGTPVNASVISFVSIDGMPKPIRVQGSRIDNGLFCLCHVTANMYPAMDKSDPCIVFRCTKIGGNASSNGLKLYLLPVEGIDSPAIVVPDVVPDYTKRKRVGAGYPHKFSDRTFLVIQPKNIWADEFLEHIREWCDNEDSNVDSGSSSDND